ncbi:energy transducer TonB, partial [Rhodoplanes sp. TEM]
AAPAPGAGSGGASLASWQGRVAAHLNRHKTYPSEARARNESGIVVLVFSIDRSGGVISASLGRSSGSAALDREATALARRASPVPAPPPGVGGSRIRLTVPIRFNVR